MRGLAEPSYARMVETIGAGSTPPSGEGLYSPLPSMANTKAKRNIKRNTKIPKANLSLNLSPLYIDRQKPILL